MPPRTANAVAQKWAQRMGQATTAYKQGVTDTTVNPMQLASRAATLWLANTTAAKAKFQRNTANTPKTVWVNNSLGKGANNLASGATAAEPKMAAVMSTLLPFITSVKSSLPARGNLEANIARSAAFQRGMAKYQKPAGA